MSGLSNNYDTAQAIYIHLSKDSGTNYATSN